MGLQVQIQFSIHFIPLMLFVLRVIVCSAFRFFRRCLLNLHHTLVWRRLIITVSMADRHHLLDLCVLHFHKSRDLRGKEVWHIQGDDEMRWDEMSVRAKARVTYDRNGYGAGSGTRTGLLWQTAAAGALAPGNDSRTEAETGHCFGSQWICIQNAALARPGLYGKSS